MRPVIFRIPFIEWDIPGYGLALMIGFLLTVVWAVRRAVKSQANPDVVLNCAFIALLAGVAGARLMYVVHYWEQYGQHGNWLTVFRAVIDVRQGGLEIYGGVIAALLGVLIYFKFWRHSTRWYLDIMAPSLALGMGLGRIGCFLNGCCWGGVCDLPWAVRFPFGSNAMVQQWHDGKPGLDLPKELLYTLSGTGATSQPSVPLPREVLWVSEAEITRIQKLRDDYTQAKTAEERARIERQGAILGCCIRHAASLGPIYTAMQANDMTLAELRQLAQQYRSLPVHPTQPYSTVALLLLALLLSALYWRRTRDGQVICTLLLFEPWTRYVIEVIRNDNPIDTLGTFTISQFLAVLLSLTGLIGLIVLQYLPARSPRAMLWVPEEGEKQSSDTTRKEKRRNRR